MHSYNLNGNDRRFGLLARAGLVLACAALTAPGQLALAQANVVENQTARLYVDAVAGKDSNPGTQTAALRTIGAAVRRANGNAAKNVGTRIEVGPGAYREDVEVGWAKYYPALTIEAVTPGAAVITGSDVYTNWYQGTANTSIYSHYFAGLRSSPVPTSWPADVAPVVYRKEMVFVNGSPLTQVMSLAQMQEGTFFVDQSSHELQIWPAAGTDVYHSLIEVAVRPHTLQVRGRKNVVLRGLVLEHATSNQNDSSVNIDASNNVLVDSVQANWNNWGGLHLSHSTNITVQNSVANYNGAVGFGAYRMTNGLFQSDESDYNNWRGAQGAFYDFGMGGTKFFNVHGLTVQNLFAYNNNAQGLWFDTDNRDITVLNATLVGNSIGNLQVELNDGPILIKNSTLCYGEVGVNLVNSSQVSFVGDWFYGNGGMSQHMRPQLFLEGRPGGRNFVDWETHQYHNVISSNIIIRGNAFEDTDPNQYNFGTYLEGSDWAAFQSTVNSNTNRWHDSLKNTAFVLPHRGGIPLSAWQSDTGQDSYSRWTPSAAPLGCAAPAPAFSDFAIELDAGSYTATRGLATIHARVKNFNTNQPVSLDVVGLPSTVSANFSAPQLAAQTGQFGAATALTLSGPKQKGVVPVVIFARAGSQVHTVQVDVNFN